MKLTRTKESTPFLASASAVEYLNTPAVVTSASLQSRGDSIGAILVDSGRINLADVEHILRFQKEQKLNFGDAALKLKLVNERDIQHALSRQFSYTFLRPKEGGFANDLVAAYLPFSPQVEALRALRSQLILRWFGAGRKTLAIVSPHARDGRSYLAANLAVIFSQLGERTLLIDANLRNPRQHSIFNLSGSNGLTSILSGRAGLDAIVCLPYFENLSALTAGPVPPNPLELLGRPEFSKLVTDLNPSYDVILFDTPAGVAYSDTVMIAAQVDGALMVTRKNHTRLDAVKTLATQINSSGAQVIGSILNQY
jgi:protein-tyrosine kinase